VRERIFVGNAKGNIGAVVKRLPPRQHRPARYAGWTDQNFKPATTSASGWPT
jgi:hypothetical protein